MTTPRRRDEHGSITVGSVTSNDGSAIAIGHGSIASRIEQSQQAPIGVDELTDLRLKLTEIITSGTARAHQLSAQVVGEAIDHTEVLEDELRAPEPRDEVVRDRLGKLAALLAGVAAVSEALKRVADVLGPVFGLR